jgi:hypothetical protein
MATKHDFLIGAAAITALSCAAVAGTLDKPSVSTPVTELTYGPTGVSDGIHGELNAAPAYGDLAHGAHGTGSKDVPLPVGSYWFQKGGERHVTKCISPNECILFISQNERFDYVTDAASKDPRAHNANL